jgi:Fe-S cluster biogenesis protein NfuA
MENAEFQQPDFQKNDFQKNAAQVEQLVARVQALPDADARATAIELMQSLMDLHGAALTRAVEVLAESGEQGRASLAKLGDDPLVCGLLVLYGIHPVPMEDRVAAALDRVTPQLRKQSGSAELLSVTDGVVRVSIQGTGNSCHSSPDQLKDIVERAIREAAPEVIEVVAEGLASSHAGFVPLNMLQTSVAEEKKYEESTA